MVSYGNDEGASNAKPSSDRGGFGKNWSASASYIHILLVLAPNMASVLNLR